MPITRIPDPVTAPGELTTGVLAPLENTLEVSRGRLIPGAVFPWLVVVRPGGAFVLLVINDKGCLLSSTMAHEVGKKIVALAAQSVGELEVVVVSVNGERYSLPLEKARNLAKGLIRKADDADNFQLANKVKIVKG